MSNEEQEKQRKIWNDNHHVIEAQQFDTEYTDKLFARATDIKMSIKNGDPINTLSGKLMHSIFFEESTRTRFSFESAAHHLGMGVVHTESAKVFSSIAKGESIEDMVRVLVGYQADAIVMRTNLEGMTAKAAAVSDIPVISAGDGKGQHPTQSLLDLFTIDEKLGRKDNLKVVFGGDMANGRTVRSLAYLLSKYDGNRFHFISPPELQLSDDIRKYFDYNDIQISESNSIDGQFDDADVVYWTRTQLEKGSSADIREIILDEQAAQRLPGTAIIMHPLPRVKEIEIAVDDLPQAAYFDQAENGLYVRMALLEHVLGKLQ